ncbi:hypothetical protein EMIT0194MI4_50138 [Pseudomonas sp. IT-194MI4]
MSLILSFLVKAKKTSAEWPTDT